MPKIRNFSDRENARPWTRFISDDLNPVHLLTGLPSPLAQKAAPPPKCDFVRKRFSRVRQTDNVRYTPNKYQQSDTFMLTPDKPQRRLQRLA